MASDQTQRPTTPAPTRTSAAERLGVSPEKVVRVSLNPWVWAAKRGLKPLPGREVPPEYRHLFEPQGQPSDQ